MTHSFPTRRSSDLIVAELFLQARMTVIPVGPRLDDRKFVDEFRTRLDSGEADARHAVHLERQDQDVPMDRTVLVEVIYDGELRSLSSLEAYQRRRHCAVDSNRTAQLAAYPRAEERSVGNEWVSTCRSRWWPYHQKKKTNNPHTQEPDNKKIPNKT